MYNNANQNKKTFSQLLKSFCKGFGLLLTYEIIEELIEEAIAYTITTVVAKAMSFLLVVLLTQTIKVSAKGVSKGLIIMLKPVVKRFTYKEGNDKIIKIKRFIDMCKEKIENNKFLQFLKNNPKSIFGVIGGVLASLGGGAFTTGSFYFFNVELPTWARIVIGAVVCILLAVAEIIGVCGAGFESDGAVALRQSLKKLLSNLGFSSVVNAVDTLENDFEAKEKADAEAQAKAEEEAKAKYKDGWRSSIANGTFDGSLEEYIELRKTEEAEAEAKLQARLAEEELAKNRETWRVAVINGEFDGSFADWQSRK